MLLTVGPVVPRDAVEAGGVRARVLAIGTDILDIEGVIAERYDMKPGTAYLIRPDQHVAARWRQFDSHKASAALARCLGR